MVYLEEANREVDRTTTFIKQFQNKLSPALEEVLHVLHQIAAVQVNNSFDNHTTITAPLSDEESIGENDD